MRFKRLLLTLALVVALVIGMALPINAATTADVTVTATPEYLAITNDTSNWTIGAIAENTTKWWTPTGVAPAEPFVDGDMNATITNAGSVTSDVDIKCAAGFTGGVGWTMSLDTSPAADEVNLRAGITGTADEAGMVQVITTSTDLKTSLAAAGTIKWCMELETGTFTDGVAKSGTVRLTITKS